jgi:hypothetical protein
MNKEVDYCLNICQGLDKKCDKYIDILETGICNNYQALLPVVKEKHIILSNNNIERLIDKYYDKTSFFMYDIKREALFKSGKMIAGYKELPEQWKQYKNVHKV